MKKILALAGSALLAVTLAVPVATPAAAQGISFGWSIGSGYGYHYRDRDYRPWWRPHYRPRAGVYINVDPPRMSSSRAWARHVARCEARYRSYNPRTDMYLGYDGEYHRCRL